jgi:hypothetical protein
MLEYWILAEIGRICLTDFFDCPDPKDSFGKGCLSKGILRIGMITGLSFKKKL